MMEVVKGAAFGILQVRVMKNDGYLVILRAELSLEISDLTVL